jgi:hypothetical protein
MCVLLRAASALLFAVLIAGCASIGPATIRRDRTDYSGAMAGSWKQQMLLNIVKFRYFDPPVFLDVSSVVSSQELQARGSIGSRLFPTPFGTAQDFTDLGASGQYTDRPTISYTPLTGNRFINSLLRPIPPQTIFAMIEAGHDTIFIFRLAVRAINGIYNSSFSPARARREDPAFRRVTQAIRRLQQAGAIGLRTEGGSRQTSARRADRSGSGDVAWVFFRRNAGAAVEQDIRLVKTMLRLEMQRDEFALTFGSFHRRNELALLTRSMQEILIELAAGVEVPEQDLAQGRATPSRLSGDSEAPARPLIRIHASDERPIDAFAAVNYRERWFWVDDRDLPSKRVFMFLMTFSALSETRAVPQVPILTIPAN